MTRGLLALLQIVGADGVDLTGAGYLKPAHVQDLVEALGQTGQLYGKANREDNVPVVGALRALATSAKLIRKYKGRLVPTAATRKSLPGSVLWTDRRVFLAQVLAALPTAKDEAARDAAVIWMLSSVLGLSSTERQQLALELLTEAGWSLNGGEPISAAAVSWLMGAASREVHAIDPDLMVRSVLAEGPPDSVVKALSLVLLGQVDRVLSPR